MATQIIFDSGSDATPITATSIDATSLNVTGSTTLGPLSAGASTLGATTVTSLSTTGNIGAASLNVTTATIGTLVSTDAIIANGTVTAPELTADAVALPSSGARVRLFALSPAADLDYELPDIGVNGEVAVGTRASYQVDITNQTDTVTYANLTLTAARIARTVTISISSTGAFDGMSETSLTTDPSTPLPARYRPPTSISYHPMMVRSGGIMGVGYAFVSPNGDISFVGRDGGAWSGADCIIIPTGFSYNV